MRMRSAVCVPAVIAAMTMASAMCVAETYTIAEVGKHVGGSGTVCGTIVDSTVSKYGVGGHGRPISFQIDKAAPDTEFFFVAFAQKDVDIDEYRNGLKGKKVCVTGKIGQFNSVPYVMTTEPSQIKVMDAAQ
jgi:hypothetical protein